MDRYYEISVCENTESSGHQDGSLFTTNTILSILCNIVPDIITLVSESQQARAQFRYCIPCLYSSCLFISIGDHDFWKETYFIQPIYEKNWIDKLEKFHKKPFDYFISGRWPVERREGQGLKSFIRFTKKRSKLLREIM